MGLIDTTFAPLPTALLADWGQNITYIKTTTPRTYNPTTGAVTKDTVSYDVKVVITKLTIKEFAGLYQENDVKILIDPAQIDGNYITTGDYFEVPYEYGAQVMKVIDPTTYRGANPVFFVVIARPQ